MPPTKLGTTLSIDRVDIHSETAQTLILELNGELSNRYAEPGATHFRLDADEVALGRGGFFVAAVGGLPAGCGAFRRMTYGDDDCVGELKRMFVRPGHRGKGIGRALLDRLESEARALGMTRIVLETGTRQPEAIALYEGVGFTRIALYGEYLGSSFSVCMTKTLSA